jgi:Flp pilus assembly protein TadG
MLRGFRISKWFKEEEGTVAIIFASMIVPVVILIGSAIDFSRAMNGRMTMQFALDSAVLAAGRAYDQTGDTGTATEVGAEFFNAAMQNAGINATITTNTADGQGNVVMAAKTEFDTSFLKLAGVDKLEIDTESQSLTSDEGGKDVELAIVFDVTGSMTDNNLNVDRMAIAKEAANDLLTTMLPDGVQNQSVRISLVPFSSKVNAGDYAAAVTGVADQTNVTTPTQVYVCTKNFFIWCVAGYWTTQNVTTTTYRQDCVVERLVASGHAYDDAPPSEAAFHAFTATNANSVSCVPVAPVVPLTDNRQTLEDAINDLEASGGTAGHLGLAWGWYTISQNWAEIWPSASDPEASAPQNRLKALIIMTDGEFNYHYNNSYQAVNEDSSGTPNAGNGSSASQASQICENMKDAGVEVFAVGVELSSNSARTMLENCVSEPNNLFEEHYYDVANSLSSQSGLRAAFQDIANNIATATGTGNQRLRLTR